MPPIWNPAVGFEGTLLDLLEAMLPYCPRDVSRLESIQSWLVRQLEVPEQVMACRIFSDEREPRASVRGHDCWIPGGRPFFATDNELTAALFGLTRRPDIQFDSRMSLLEHLRREDSPLTLGFLGNKDNSAHAYSVIKRHLEECFGIRRIGMATVDPLRTEQSVQLAHMSNAADGILPQAGGSTASEIDLRVFRSLTPLNVFPFPAGRKSNGRSRPRWPLSSSPGRTLAWS